MKSEVRIDKWMWAVRIFKTRTIAVEACKKGRVMIQGVTVKPARMVKPGDEIQVRKSPIVYTFRVLDITEKRMGAKLVPQYMLNCTSAEQYAILERHTAAGFVDRAKGTGRPTKKDRRDLDTFGDVELFDDDFDFEFDFDTEGE